MTYTQIHIQCVFAVKFRDAMIDETFDERLRRYITGITQNKGHKMIAINNMPDHLHMLFGMRPHQSLSSLMQIVKGESSEWINKNKLTRTRVQWQEGYGAFSYEKSLIPVIANYVENQKQHHKKVSFLEEYRQLLAEFEIEFNDAYIFKDLE